MTGSKRAWSWVGALAILAAGSAGCSSPPGGPAIDASWLQAKLAEWPYRTGRPVRLGAVLHAVSYDGVNQAAHTDAVTDAELRMLVATGVDVVRIDLNYDPWLQGDAVGIEKYTHAVAAIRAAGKQVMIADAAAEGYRSHPIPWAAFQAAWVERVRTIAALYQPDYYVVVKEPGWYWLMPSDALFTQPWARPDEWVALTEQLVAAVRAVSPATRIAVATPGDSLYDDRSGYTTILQYYEAAARMPGLDILGFDDYDATAFEDTQRFVDEVGLHGKAMWLLETWASAGPRASSAAEASQEPVDAGFLKVAAYFTQNVGGPGAGAVYFFSDYFASYAQRPTTEAGLLDFYAMTTPLAPVLRALAAQVQP